MAVASIAAVVSFPSAKGKRKAWKSMQRLRVQRGQKQQGGGKGEEGKKTPATEHSHFSISLLIHEQGSMECFDWSLGSQLKVRQIFDWTYAS